MATSPDFIRLAANATRALADTALDALRDVVLVVDARHRQLPVILANAAARKCLRGETANLIECPLMKLLGASAAAKVERLVLTIDGEALSELIAWRHGQDEHNALTEIKPLIAAGQRLVMLSFAPPSSQPELSAVVDVLPFDFLVLDADLKVTHANASAIKTAGSIPGGLLGCSALMLTPTRLLPPDVFARALKGEDFYDDALAFEEPGRPTRRFELSVRSLDSPAGTVALLVLSTEVTERRMRTRAQGSNERRLLALTEHAKDIIAVADAEGRLHYISGGLQNALGYTVQERESSYVFEHVHPDDRDEVMALYRRVVAGEIDGFSRELRVRHKDGSYHWLESRAVSALNNPLIRGVVINSRDITERKQAEFKLAQREEVFRLAADAVDGIIFEWDLVKGCVHRSRGVEEVLGIAPEDLEPSTNAWLERIHPRDFVAAKRAIGAALLNGRGWTLTYRIRDSKGRYRSILDRAVVQRNAAGHPLRAVGCCVDISEIKRLTDILNETQRTANIGGWECSYATREVTWTEEMFRIFDTNPKDCAPSWDAMVDRCTPESAEKLREAFRRGETGGQIDLELEICTAKNQRIWVRVIGHVETLNGRPFRAFGSVQHIQAERLAQIALENSTGWLRLSMNMANLHAWRWDRAQNSFEFATLDDPQMQLPNIHADMESMLSRIHPKDQSAVKRAIDSAFAGNVEIREEFELLGNDGRYRSYATTARPMFDGTVPRGLVGVIQDVTARRDSERRLRRSEELLRVTTANTADTLILLDTALRVRFINKGLRGLDKEQIIGKDIDAVLPTAARMRVREKLRHIVQTGETLSFEFEASEGGCMQFLENRAVLVRHDGLATGISISMRDITERKRLEQEILDVSGRERQSIGRDLHDGLGQELTGVALMLRGLAGRLQRSSPEVLDNVNEIVGHMNQSIETARSLARGLLPVRTESGGLVFALKALAEKSRDLYGLEVNFRSELCPQFHFSETDASHLYRITQEALTNAARHGHATRVEIFLGATAIAFALRITDNGDGFAHAKLSASGMGLKIMKYRADMIGAKFAIGANDPRGTQVAVTG